MIGVQINFAETLMAPSTSGLGMGVAMGATMAVERMTVVAIKATKNDEELEVNFM